MLEVKNLMVFYENALALNDVSIEIHQGEIRGLIGSNSAGKSTLLHTISGLMIDIERKERARDGTRITVVGEVLYEDREISRVRPAERVRQGIVLCRERHPVFPESSVLENLRIAGYLRPRNEIDEAIDFVFTIFPRLVGLRKRRAGFLSGGEQQMLAIGMALVVSPRLLLLDEPLLGLSPAVQKHLIESIVQIRDERRVTILIAEQFARPLFPCLDYCYLIENGMLSLSGLGDELLENPDVRAAYFGI